MLAEGCTSYWGLDYMVSPSAGFNPGASLSRNQAEGLNPTVSRKTGNEHFLSCTCRRETLFASPHVGPYPSDQLEPSRESALARASSADPGPRTADHPAPSATPPRPATPPRKPRRSGRGRPDSGSRHPPFAAAKQNRFIHSPVKVWRSVQRALTHSFELCLRLCVAPMTFIHAHSLGEE